MAYLGAGGAAGAAAAARRRRMVLAEEEDMARYTQDDLNNDWEFKGVDPYRTRYGTPVARYAVLVSVLIGVLLAGLGILGLSLADGIGAATKLWTVAAALPLVLIAMVVLGLLVLVMVRSR